MVPQQISVLPLEWARRSRMGCACEAMLGLWQLSIYLQHRQESCPEPPQVLKLLELSDKDRATSGRVNDQE